MTASEVVSGWPEATVERVAEAISDAEGLENPDDVRLHELPDHVAEWYRIAARAALSVLPDPTADTVLLAELVKELRAPNDALIAALRHQLHANGKASHRTPIVETLGALAEFLSDRAAIAALLAGGGE